MRILASLVLLGAVACASPSKDVQARDDGLTNGLGPTDAAVGVLLALDGTRTNIVCTATLVDASTLATSRRCAPSLTDAAGRVKPNMYFKLAADLGDPSAKVVAIDAVSSCLESTKCGFAAAHLANPISDVAPIPLAPFGVTANRDQPYSTVGFDPSLRRVTASALVHARYGGSLVVAGGGPNGAHLCVAMDVGAPLLVELDGQAFLLGVASIPHPDALDREVCSAGTPFHTLNASVRQLFGQPIPIAPGPSTVPTAAACGDETEAGRCDGDVAVRCTTAAEGVRRVTRVDCAESLQTCRPPGTASTTVSCGDAP